MAVIHYSYHYCCNRGPIPLCSSVATTTTMTNVATVIILALKINCSLVVAALLAAADRGH